MLVSAGASAEFDAALPSRGFSPDAEAAASAMPRRDFAKLGLHQPAPATEGHSVDDTEAVSAPLGAARPVRSQ